MSLTALLERWAYELAPPVMLILRRAKARKGSADSKAREQTWAALPQERLEKLVDLEWERARHIDDKLSKATASLSVAVTLGAAVVKSVADGIDPSWQKDAVLFLLCLAMVLMAIAAVLGFNGLRPKERFGYGPDFAVKLSADASKSPALLAAALAGFEVENRMRANEAMTAVDSLRNGVVLFAAAVMLGLFAPSAPPPVDEAASAEPALAQAMAEQNILLTEVRDALRREADVSTEPEADRAPSTPP
jgi:hypothetical protein